MEQTARRLRIGVVGAGANTRSRHIPGLLAQPGVEISCIANRSLESSQRAAAGLGIAHAAADWRELVAREDVDAVMIGTWPYLHCPITLAALEAGKHVLTEARMAMNATEARQMLAASRRRPDLVTQIVPSPFTLSVDRTVQRLLRENYLGRLLRVEIHAADGQFIDEAAPLGWRQDADLSGFNIMTLGIWYECLLRWGLEAVDVVARGTCFVPQRADADGILRAVRIPDHVSVLAGLVGGAQADITVTSGSGLVRRNEILLFGSEGTLRFADGVLSGGRRGDAALQPLDIPAHERGSWRVEEEFVNAVRGTERITHTRFEDGVKYMEFTEAVARSLATGRTQAIPLC